MCFDLGLSIAIPTIMISSLIGVNTNADETIMSTSSEASWIGRIFINITVILFSRFVFFSTHGFMFQLALDLLPSRSAILCRDSYVMLLAESVQY